MLQYPHMSQTVTVSKDYLKNIEIQLLELTQAVRKLIAHNEEKPDVFEQMVKSPKFKKEVKDTLALYKKDPSQFSNPFDALRKHRKNV